jgi:peptidyl-prolyl cis-trans isomerase A (cyclophilin A)
LICAGKYIRGGLFVKAKKKRKSKKIARWRKNCYNLTGNIGKEYVKMPKILRNLVIISVASAVLLQAGCDRKSEGNEKTIQKDGKIMTAEKKAPVKVRIETTKGDIVIELNPEKAPVSCKNFLQYVDEQFYDGTIFHRVIKDFMIQGGGFNAQMRQKQPRSPIINEAKNGLKNVRGTIAMARTSDPDSATAQFFINHRNNDFLNYGARDAGYAVFGKVVEGMDVVDAIAAVPTKSGDIPVETIVINSIRVE